MGSFTLRVTPEVLEQTAEKFWDIIERIDRRFQQIEDASAKTRGYWKGEAGDADREGYASYKDDIAYILDRLDEHPSDLLKMAGIYRNAERENVSTSAQLKTDMLV